MSEPPVEKLQGEVAMIYCRDHEQRALVYRC